MRQRGSMTDQSGRYGSQGDQPWYPGEQHQPQDPYGQQQFVQQQPVQQQGYPQQPQQGGPYGGQQQFVQQQPVQQQPVQQQPVQQQRPAPRPEPVGGPGPDGI